MMSHVKKVYGLWDLGVGEGHWGVVEVQSRRKLSLVSLGSSTKCGIKVESAFLTWSQFGRGRVDGLLLGKNVYCVWPTVALEEKQLFFWFATQWTCITKHHPHKTTFVEHRIRKQIPNPYRQYTIPWNWTKPVNGHVAATLFVCYRKQNEQMWGKCWKGFEWDVCIKIIKMKFTQDNTVLT